VYCLIQVLALAPSSYFPRLYQYLRRGQYCSVGFRFYERFRPDVPDGAPERSSGHPIWEVVDWRYWAYPEVGRPGNAGRIAKSRSSPSKFAQHKLPKLTNLLVAQRVVQIESAYIRGCPRFFFSVVSLKISERQCCRLALLRSATLGNATSYTESTATLGAGSFESTREDRAQTCAGYCRRVFKLANSDSGTSFATFAALSAAFS
jgi:hypothetical protein